MKSFQNYIAETNKVYEFRIKVAGTNPKDNMDRIKDAIDTYELNTIGPVKSMPIQTHVDFPKWGPCECWQFEISVNYPVTTDQLRQVIRERAGLTGDCVCVYTKDQDDYNEEAEARGKDNKGSVLEQPELKADEGGQELVGQKRNDSFLKQLDTRKYEFAAKGETPAKAMTASTDTKSPMTQQNKITSPFKGQK